MHSRAGSTDIPGTGKNSPISRVVVASPGGDRWRSPVAHAEWDLAEQIVQLKIADTVEGNRTPPRRTSIASAVLEASPLETNSDASSPASAEGPLRPASHNREASADSGMRALNVPPITPPTKIGAVGEPRERPHSYSGGLSTADLKRLQLTDVGGGSGSSESTPLNTKPPTNWSSFGDQPTYPSLSNSPTRGGANSQSNSPPSFAQNTFGQDASESEFTPQQRQFSPIPQPPVPRGTGSPGNSAFAAGPRPTPLSNGGMPYGGATTAQMPRPFSPNMVPPPPPSAGFSYPPQASLAAMQQMYEMMIPPENPAVARIQQQHGAFRPTHVPSVSDPASLRDAALLIANMQAFAGANPAAAAGVYPQPPVPAMAPIYGGGFYPGPQDMYASTDIAQLMVAARLQAAQQQQQQQQQQQNYANQFGLSLPPQQQMALAATLGQNGVQQQGVEAAVNGGGPSANNRKLGLYKTELCRSWEEKGTCRYGTKCQFAHGEDELRTVARHPKYKTEICRTFWVSGSCPYGKRCCFIHTELPASGAPPGADGTPPPTNLSPSNRSRSASTNSEPADASSTSLLARITAKRNQGPSAGGGSPSQSATPIDGSTPQAASFSISSRPGALRVDTTTVGGTSAMKENKSAYPTYQATGIIHSGVQDSPIAVTAHPDFGRQRMELGTQTGSRLGKSVASPNNRHSFNGTDLNIDFSNPASLASLATPVASNPPSSLGGGRASGHMRSGSAGNWSQVSRPSRLGPYSSIPGNDIKASPWAAGSELAMGASARHS